jgi:hypothetical protein
VKTFLDKKSQSGRSALNNGSSGISMPSMGVKIIQPTQMGEEDLSLQAKFTVQRKEPGDNEEALQMKSMPLQLQAPGEEEESMQMKPFQIKGDTVQKQAVDEEEESMQMKPFQLKSDVIQKKEPAEEEPLQGRFIPEQRKANTTGLPDDLKSGVENLSGIDISDVKVHYNSDKPAQLQALAYAQGTDIHVGPGQEKHLPHEAWHVVQQKQGRVQPTMQMKEGVAVNDDKGLEHEADVMGQKSLSVSPFGVQRKQKPISGINVIQRTKMFITITGLTHLVEMTGGGSIYNEDYENNEYAEVTGADTIEIDSDDSYLSRRGPNQETNSERDREGPQGHEWDRVLRLNGTDTSSRRIFVRRGMFVPVEHSPVSILAPRNRTGVDGAIQNLSVLMGQIRGITPQKDRGKLWRFDTIGSDLISLKNGLVKKDENEVNFESLYKYITSIILKIDTTFKETAITEESYLALKQVIENLDTEFKNYIHPKDALPMGDLVGREQLFRFGITSLDLGGIGAEGPTYLNVNITDRTNSPHFILIGDAMHLHRSFQPDCVQNVVARLLPLILMVDADTNENRVRAIELVMNGVEYVMGNHGPISIEFNDNSGEATVTSEQLQAIAVRHHCALINKVPGHVYRCFEFKR